MLDANVLFSEWTRALCMALAQHRDACLYWTPVIADECFRNLKRLNRLHTDDAQAQQETLAQRMGAHVLEYDHSAYLADVRCVDEKDRHVAATALALRHRLNQPVALLTWNLKDFPRKNLLKLGVVRYNLDELLVELVKTRQAKADELLNNSLVRLQHLLESAPLAHPTDYQLRARPLPENAEEWVQFLARNKMHRVSAMLQRG